MGLLIAAFLATMFAYVTTRARVEARGFHRGDVLLLYFLLAGSIVLSRRMSSIVLFVVFGGGAAAGFVGSRLAMRAQASGRESKPKLAAEGAAVQRLD
jgi:hypothetical protein